MTDFSWLQYITNPYAMIAVIAAVLGITFRAVLKNTSGISQKRPGFLVAMYGMFLVCITSLGFGAIGISFIMQGRGATDVVAAVEAPPSEVAMAPRSARAPGNVVTEFQKTESTGWLWAGEVVEDPDSDDENEVIKITNQTINKSEVMDIETRVKNIIEINLRATPPQWTFWSWFTMSYELGELVETIQPNKTMNILDKDIVGNQLWLKVSIR